MENDGNLLGIRGFLIDAPEFGAPRGQRDGAIIIDNGRILEIGDYDEVRPGGNGRDLLVGSTMPERRSSQD
jgi:cytosine/adenosine deaminase-related metal-dependent hydrolase